MGCCDLVATPGPQPRHIHIYRVSESLRPLPLDFGDVIDVAFAKAWPKLQSLRLNDIIGRFNAEGDITASQITLQGLASISEHCPHLSTLEIPVLDATSVLPISSFPAIGHQNMRALLITELHNGATANLLDIALILDRLFPLLDTKRRICIHNRNWRPSHRQSSLKDPWGLTQALLAAVQAGRELADPTAARQYSSEQSDSEDDIDDEDDEDIWVSRSPFYSITLSQGAQQDWFKLARRNSESTVELPYSPLDIMRTLTHRSVLYISSDIPEAYGFERYLVESMADLMLTTPDTFSAFPFKPYDIQLDLMRHVYSSVENGKVTIAESPTGTGKTLSLLCASLTWLKDEQERARKGKLQVPADSTEGPDWVVAQTVERRRRELEAAELEYASRLAAARKREAQLRRVMRGHVRKKQVKIIVSSLLSLLTYQLQKVTDDTLRLDDSDDDDPFLPESDDTDLNECNLSPAVLALMKKLQGKTAGSPEQEQEPTCTKIYYASRTHSQLAQVLHELEKLHIKLNVAVTATEKPSIQSSGSTKRTASAVEEEDSEAGDQEGYGPRAVSLGSRKQLCINEHLRAKAGDLDEACRQMLGEKGKKRCPHLPAAEEETKMLDLRDQILAVPKDIEELFLAGQAADLISTLLSLSTTRLPFRTLVNARHQLSIYLSRFRNRLSTVHAVHLKRLMNLLDALCQYSEEWRDAHMKDVPGKARPPDVEVMTSAELLGRLGRKTEGVNLLEVEKYLRDSKIARKISGYSVKTLEKAAAQDATKLARLARLASTTPPLHAVESFISALSASSEDGRVTVSLVDDQVEIKYQHLNPATYFQEVVDVARAVILAGGTMSPIEDVVNQLFTALPAERLSTFSCGHIIPATNLKTIVLKKGPRGGDLQFKYQQRSDEKLMSELGQILFNFANIVPGGMVVFVPSYSVLNAVMKVWRSSGLLEKLNAKKKRSARIRRRAARAACTGTRARARAGGLQEQMRQMLSLDQMDAESMAQQYAAAMYRTDSPMQYGADAYGMSSGHPQQQQQQQPSEFFSHLNQHPHHSL
ncbi:hypothetical protein NUW54_g5905 [Trametes sanguinea]|uniref:Uncharacterized protein n=1 Tax=Trametes sanguinea TaxID=158606 RepID=A0ACC1PV05_9APHY|nr:hypothetical protein NUW54_g5905 [Trametes sanguinea]